MIEFCPVCGQADNCGDCDHTPPPIDSTVMARGWAHSEVINDDVTVPPGTTGTVTGHGPQQVWVKWDNGATLSLVYTDKGQDHYETVKEAP